MSRAIFAAGALLASASLVQAGDHASFSPDLRDSATSAVAQAAPAPVAEASPATGRGRSSRRRTRVARGRAARAVAMAALKARAAENAAPLTIGGIPAPLPPSHDADASDAVATLETPLARSAREMAGSVEQASPGPQAAAEASGSGQREAPSNTLAKLLAKHALANGVPLKLAEAVVRIESRGNPRASNHGALGLMQIKYETARAAGFAGPAVRLFVADINLEYGMKVLGQAYKAAGGDTCGALMRYQSGHLARHMNAANRAYCSRARSFMAGA